VTVRLGVTFVPTLPPEALIPLARAAEDAGLDDVWVWEDCFKESAIATAAVALASTTRLGVGMALLPAPLRNVALTAMEIATLARIFPGRLRAGVGHGVQPWMDQVGARVESPLTLLREYATALKLLLAGEKVTTEGRYVKLDGVRLDHPPHEPFPLLMGGSGPRTLALCGELGAGTLLGNTLTEAEVRQAAGTTEHGVVVTLIAATGDGAEQRLAGELAVWDTAPGRGVGVAGTAETVAAAVRGLAAAGASAVQVEPTADEPDLEGFVYFLGREVRPLL
jgi:5,10-methylenetetrahydromethanopterin reductase